MSEQPSKDSEASSSLDSKVVPFTSIARASPNARSSGADSRVVAGGNTGSPRRAKEPKTHPRFPHLFHTKKLE